MDEQFQPRWATLVESMRQRREILEQVLQQEEQKAAQEGKPAQLELERNRYAMIAGVQEHYISELEESLWAAEEMLKSVGRKPPTRNDQLIAEVRFLLHCGKLDQEAAIARETEANERAVPGELPPSEDVNAVCGQEGLTIRSAVRMALESLEAYDRQGKRRTAANLQDIVEGKLEAAIKTYNRSRGK